MNRNNRPTGPSQRMLRVGELVRHVLAAVFARVEVEDDVLRDVVITVPEVRMTPDLKLANVYIMPLGGENAEAVASALNAHARFIRGRIAPALDLKYAPQFRFYVDVTFDEYGRIDELLRSDRVQRDLGPREGEDDEI